MVPQSEAHQYYSSSGNIGGSLEGALSKSDFAVEVVTCGILGWNSEWCHKVRLTNTVVKFLQFRIQKIIYTGKESIRLTKLKKYLNS